MPSEGLVSSETSLRLPGRAKKYNRIKLIAGIASSIVSFLFLVVLVWQGYVRDIERWAEAVTSNRYAALLIFTGIIGVMQSVLTMPAGFYTGYIVEHRFNLSNQSIGRWAWERMKGLMVGLPLAAGVLLLLYYCMVTYGDLWWLPVSVLLSLVSIILARLAPVLILPLFYRFTPLPEGALRERIMQLCTSAGLRVEGIFSFNLSKNTKKANAGFTGIGRSKRIILGDTLVKEFTEDEIATVFAHELGHYKHRHITIGIVTGILSTFAGLYITSLLYGWSAAALGFSGITELAALPLLAIWLSLFGLVTSPIGNAVSRRHERQADRYAAAVTGKRDAFVSALRRLAAMNLADQEPHPVIEFLFYSHPSISRRIHLLETAA